MDPFGTGPILLQRSAHIHFRQTEIQPDQEPNPSGIFANSAIRQLRPAPTPPASQPVFAGYFCVKSYVTAGHRHAVTPC